MKLKMKKMNSVQFISKKDTLLIMPVTLGEYPSNLKSFERKGSHSKRMKYTSNIICRDTKTLFCPMRIGFFFVMKCPFFLHIGQSPKP